MGYLSVAPLGHQRLFPLSRQGTAKTMGEQSLEPSFGVLSPEGMAGVGQAAAHPH